MAQLTDAQLLTKYNDSSTGLFKDNTNKEIVPNRPRSLVTDLTDSFFNKTDDAYTAAFPSTNVAGTDTYTANLIPAITAYASGQKVQLVFANPNTGPATINLNGLGAKAITKNGDSPISAGDITAGQALFLYYDGTQFQIQGGSGGGGGASDWGDLGGTITDQTDLVAYVDSEIDAAIAGLKWKNAARVATTVAGTLATSFENGDTVDGVVLATNDRILIKNQATQSENGIYTVNASGAPTRSTDADTAPEIEGAAITVSEGTTNANTSWIQTTDNVTINVSNIVWTQFGSSVPTADGTTAGIAKLYNNVSGTNADGAPDQNSVKVALDTKQATLTAANFGDFLVALTAKTTPIDADSIVISDSAASSDAKEVTFTELKAFLKTYFDTLYGGTTIGIQDLFVRAAAMSPRTTGGCGTQTLFEFATSLVNLPLLPFDQTTQEYAQFEIVPPRKWNNGTITVVPYWTATTGTGTVRWAINGGMFRNDDALTVALGTAQNSDDTLIAANDLHIGPATSAITLAGTGQDANLIVIQVSRDPANDTLTADALLIGISIRFTTDAALDA